MKQVLTLLSFSVLLSSGLAGQDIPSIKFGKISEAELSKKVYAIDTGAAAVVLADIGATQLKGNDKASVSLEFRHHRRIHILKSSAYDIATIEIPLYKDGDAEEKLSDLKAVTYNLENGKITESKLNVKTGVFRDKIYKNHVLHKFAFPNVKEGSVIEYEYKITSEFLFNPQPWNFQSEVPHLWSQYTISLPEFLDYMLIAQGNIPYYLSDRKDREGSYFIEITKDAYMGKTATERFDITCAVGDFRWAMKDVPALTEEPFTSSLKNYVAKLEFQLAGYRPPYQEEKVMTTWPALAEFLLKRPGFGGQLLNTELWLPTVLNPVIAGATTQTQQAERIYEYLRDNFACTGHSQLFADEPLNKIADKKRGGVAEINLLLTLMLRGAGLQADPVILSTRENGIVNDEYPVFRPFNYVICQVKADGKEWLLDASRSRLGFGKLHYDCYNGSARVVNRDATLLTLSANQLSERTQTSIFINKEPNGKWTGNVSKLYGYYGSDKLRQKLSAEGKEGLLKDLRQEYGNEVMIDNLRVDSLQKLNEPMLVHYTIKNTNEQADIIYMNPALGERYRQNPFKSADRKFMVEIPYKINDLYTLNLEIPDGYLVDEMPKPVRLLLNKNNDGVFEYNISQSGGTLTMNYKLELNKAIFYQAEYNLLREFFAQLVAKLDEQVVFKKKP